VPEGLDEDGSLKKIPAPLPLEKDSVVKGYEGICRRVGVQVRVDEALDFPLFNDLPQETGVFEIDAPELLVKSIMAGP